MKTILWYDIKMKTDMQPRVGVGVIVCWDGKFLLCLRKGSHAAGTWSIPGGHLEFGETIEECAKRELREEMGIEIDNIRFGAITTDIFKEEGKHYVSVWVVADWVRGGDNCLEPEKLSDPTWVEFDNMPQPLAQWWDTFFDSEFYDTVYMAVKQSGRC